MGSGLTQFFRGLERGRDDRHVAGAAAEVAAEKFADVAFARIGSPREIMIERNEDAGGTEAALQRVMAAERLLQDRETIGRRRQTLNGANFRAVDLRRECEAGAREPSVDLDGASAADAMLTADMGACEPERMAEEIGEQHARLRLGLDRTAVDLDANAVARGRTPARPRRGRPAP